MLQHPALIALATQLNAPPAQVVFSFAQAIGMLPLAGTSSPEHMKQYLAGLNLTLAPNVWPPIEFMAG